MCINVFLLLQVGDIQHDWLQELYKVSLIYQCYLFADEVVD